MKKLAIPKKKKVSSKTMKAKAWKIFSHYIRLRDCLKTTGEFSYGQCFTCDQLHFYAELDAGHWLQGKHNSVMFNEMNVHAQCTACNRFKHGNLIEYTLRMQNEYGPAIVGDLRALNQVSKPMKTIDYEDIYLLYSQKVKDLKV